jgi:malate dehydrogenase (oxaloacetate-decarboxylating)
VVEQWGNIEEVISLLDVVKNAKPTVLIGVSGQPGLFTEEIIRTMAAIERPIVMPLSNPTSRVEAVPADIVEWTEGKALIATGSPFAPVNYHGKLYNISNAITRIFPGHWFGCGGIRVLNALLKIC